MKLCVVSFGSMNEQEWAHIRTRHPVDSKSFSGLAPAWTTVYVRFCGGFTVTDASPEEVFFSGANGFFQIPFKFYSYIRRLKPEVVFVHGFVFPVQLLLLRLFKPRFTKIVVQHHAESPFKNRIKLALQKWAYSGIQAYVFAYREQASPFVRSKVIADETRIHEVLEGSSFFRVKNRAECRRSLNFPDKKVFLWVGRLNENKDPMTVLRAVQALSLTDQNFKLYMIYGTNELENQVKAFISHNNLSELVTLVGRVPHAQLEDWYNAADFFVAASHEESCGIAMIEAMSCGCIPIATNILSFRLLTKNTTSGFLFEPGNWQQLYEQLNAAADANLEKTREKVVQQFKRQISFDAIAKNYAAIFNTVLKH